MAGYREEMSESQAQGSEIVKKINYAETNAQGEGLESMDLNSCFLLSKLLQ